MKITDPKEGGSNIPGVLEVELPALFDAVMSYVSATLATRRLLG